VKEHIMKVNRLSNLVVLALILVLPAMTGCRKKPVGVTQLPAARQPAVAGPGPGEMAGTSLPLTNPSDSAVGRIDSSQGIPQGDASSHAGWTEDSTVFQANRLYFDFDSSVVKASERPKVTAVADNLKGNAASAVRVEGHCDERGTEEYNRALGERRALAIREELVKLGVAPTRVDTLSYGEDRPANPAHDEAAWRENRRGEFILLTPPAR
jgi:peptidoglycan-associated lipoprotein